MNQKNAVAKKIDPAAASHLHLVQPEAVTKTCGCGKPIRGTYPICGQCHLLQEAQIRGQELHPCANNCGALTPFKYCWFCKNLGITVPASEEKPQSASAPRKCKMPDCYKLRAPARLCCKQHADEADQKFQPEEAHEARKEAAPISRPMAKPVAVPKTHQLARPASPPTHSQYSFVPRAVMTEEQQAEAEFKKLTQTIYEKAGAKAVEDEFFGMAKVKEGQGGQYMVVIAGKSFTFFSPRVAAELKVYKAEAAKRAEAERLAEERARLEARRTQQTTDADDPRKKSKKGKSDGDGHNGKGKGGKNGKPGKGGKGKK
jgi:hypothetical protein